MDLEKFTERSRGFIQAAQTIAMRESHQRFTPEHLLKALLDDSEGLASNLIKRAGGAPERVVQALDLAMAKIPQVSGDAGQTYMDQQTAKVLDEDHYGLEKPKRRIVEYVAVRKLRRDGRAGGRGRGAPNRIAPRGRFPAPRGAGA